MAVSSKSKKTSYYTTFHTGGGKCIKYFVEVFSYIHNSVGSTVVLQTFSLLFASGFQLYVVLEQVALLSQCISPPGCITGEFLGKSRQNAGMRGYLPSRPVPSRPVYSRRISSRPVCNGLAFHLGQRGGVEFRTVKVAAPFRVKRLTSGSQRSNKALLCFPLLTVTGFSSLSLQIFLTCLYLTLIMPLIDSYC